MGIAVFGAVFVDIKGYPIAQFIPEGRNAGRVVELHGGVARNIAEDIGNVELRPTFVSVVDDTGIGADVVAKLRRHQVNVDYIVRRRDGLGTWLAIFNNENDVVASISKRPDLSGIADVLDEHGDEIISQCDSVVVEIDMRSYILKKVFDLAEKYHKQVYAAVSNMSIAMERRDLLSRTGCVVCNQEEASLLFSDDYSGTGRRWRGIRGEYGEKWAERLCSRAACHGAGYHRGGGLVFRRRRHRADVWEDTARGLRDRDKTCRVGDRHEGKCLSPLPAGGIRHRGEAKDLRGLTLPSGRCFSEQVHTQIFRRYIRPQAHRSSTGAFFFFTN